MSWLLLIHTMPELSTSTAKCQMPQLTTPPLHKPCWVQTKTMGNDRKLHSSQSIFKVPTQSPLQPTWCHLLVEKDPEGIFCFQHLADLFCLPNRTWPVTAVNIQARCHLFLSFCPPAYKCFLQLSLLTTSTFLICSEMSSSLQDDKSKGFPPFSSTALLSHSATVDSKNKIMRFVCNGTDNLFAIRCESTSPKFALTILMFSSNKLFSNPF